METKEVAAVEVSLESVVDQLFNGGLTTLTLANGQIVTFQQAKFKQIAAVTRLFSELLALIPREQFSVLLGLVVEAQIGSMAQGKAATDMSLNTNKIIESALGENSLLLTIFASCLDILPQFVPQFCNMSAEQFEQLDLEEAVLVATGVVATNYGFFTQKLPPLLKSILSGWNKKGSSISTTSDKSQSTTSSVG